MRTRFLPLLLWCSVLAGAASSQSPSLFEIYPEAKGSSTTYASRFLLGNANGEILTTMPVPGVTGVGEYAVGGGTATVSAFRLVTQDQNAATPSLFHVVFRSEAFGGGPDASAAGRVFRSGPLRTPTGSGTTAWMLTIAFRSPVKVPAAKTWFSGTELAVANLPFDGQLTHCADYTSGTSGDNPKQGAMNLAWGINQAATPRRHQPGPRTMRVALMTRAPVLGPGGIDLQNTRQSPTGSPNYGAGGLFPDIADAQSKKRFDDLALRIRDAASPNGLTVVFLSASLAATPISVPGWRGSFRLGLGSLAMAGGFKLDAKGETEIKLPLGPGPNALRTALAGKSLHWQAFSFGATAMTNVATHKL